MACPKCGSSEVIEGVRMLDRGHGNQEQDLRAAVYKNPDAFLFKGKHAAALTARVCGACGYVELYVANPAELLAASRDADN